MKPIQFGARDRAVFGYYDPAVGARKRTPALLLNPSGWEALRAHRSLRQLALRLADAGVDALRFDYSGTGDSWGDANSFDGVQPWLGDVEAAIEELQSLSGARQVALVGLRAGARLALEVAATRRDVACVLLWDPMPFVEPEAGGPDWSLPSYNRQVRDLAARATRLSLPPAATLAVALSAGQSLPGDLAALAGAEQLSAPQSAPAWVEERDFGAGAVPTALINRMVQWLSQ